MVSAYFEFGLMWNERRLSFLCLCDCCSVISRISFNILYNSYPFIKMMTLFLMLTGFALEAAASIQSTVVK